MDVHVVKIGMKEKPVLVPKGPVYGVKYIQTCKIMAICS